MDITVRCNQCGTGFKVKDKFAGKQGPCPKCKSVIKIPTLEELAKQASSNVTIHAPDAYGAAGATTKDGKDNKGRPTFRPISRTDAVFNPVVAVSIGGATLVALIMAFIVGRSFDKDPGTLQTVVWTLVFLISGPVAVGGYWVLRDDEREPYAGLSLYVRAVAAGAIYCLIWASVGYLNWYYPGILKNGYNWLFVAPPLMGLGALTATLALDLEATEGFFHCAFFVLAGLILRWAAGLPLG